MKTQTPATQKTEVLRQAERIVTSRVFAKARRSQCLLQYLVDAALAEPPQIVKEFTIATEVFDRDASYDPAIDATVRVEAGRLRTRLREYYAEEGREDALLIEVPKGAYRVVLATRGGLAEQAAAPQRFDPASSVEASVERSRGQGLTTERIVEQTGSRTAPVSEPAHFAGISPLDPPQSETFHRRIMEGRTWRFVLPILGCCLVLGFAGWKLARPQLAYPKIRSVAVLPLKNLSGDPAQEYFADGTTDELITQLARESGLRVVSWNSVLQEKDTKKPLKTIAGELRADLLVEGSVSRSGDTVRINAQLIDTQNDGHLWADSFEGSTSEVMALEKKAAEEIVHHAQAGGFVARSESATQPAVAIDPAAHDAYLRGRLYFDQRQPRASAEQFQRAIDLSPTYAAAYSGLAIALQSEAFMADLTAEEAVPRSMAAAEKALELDPANGDAFIARGSLEAAFLWTWDAAERDLTRGLALNPNNSYGHMMLAVYLDSVGKPDDAVKQMQEAVEVDPLSFYMARHYGSTLFYARRYDEALRQLQYAREMHPASAGVVDHWISDAYANKGMYDDAVRYDLMQLNDNHVELHSQGLLAIYQKHGWKAYWSARMEDMQRNSTSPNVDYDAGIAAMRAGRRGEAIRLLKRATEQHCYWMGVARTTPALDDLRGEPGFAEILAELHLPPAGA